MQYITFRLQTDCNQTFHSPSFSIKYALYFLYFSVGLTRKNLDKQYSAFKESSLVSA